MVKIGFDSDKYLEEQSRYILKRAAELEGRLYLEFGGKLVFDMHAARCLPGFDPNSKIKLLERIKDDTEIIICIHAGDIVRKKMRADFGITYDFDILRLIDLKEADAKIDMNGIEALGKQVDRATKLIDLKNVTKDVNKQLSSGSG